MGKHSGHNIYAFDDFRLDAEKLMLSRDGKEISLRPKVVKTLAVLVENRGEILSKNELMDRVWCDSVVEESNLSQYLYLLRKTLGNKPDGNPYIETLRRRGYRFTAEVRVLESRPPEIEVSPMPAVSSLPRRAVARRGNVLALADWKEMQPLSAPAAFSAATKPAPPKPRSARWLAVALMAVTALCMLLAYSRFAGTDSRAASQARDELTFLHLNNGYDVNDATISPDGAYFVYHEQDGEMSRLWLQQTGQSSRVEIGAPAARSYYGKTFSPDGRYIYFVARGKDEDVNSLFRVSTLGGPQSKILKDISSPVSFSPDGKEMVFRRRNDQTGESSMVVAPSDGGGERDVLKLKDKKMISADPAWSPDGKLIAFGSTNLEATLQGTCTIAGLDLQSGAVTSLSPERWDTCYRMAWTRDSRGLVFIGTKMADGQTTRRDQVYYLSYPNGESRRLTNGGVRHLTSSLGITNNDEVLAVSFSRTSQIWSMNANGDSRSAVQITQGLADGRAGLAPIADGRVGYIAPTAESLNAWIMNADGTDQKQLTRDPSVAEELRAAPNGRYFVFSGALDGYTHLFRIDADGSNLKQLTFGNTYDGDSTVSPDENWIVYDSAGVNGDLKKHSLWRISIDGGEPALLNDTGCNSPYFSPDGKFISCVYKEKDIAVISADEGSTIRVFNTVDNPILNSGVRWTPDGRSLAYGVNSRGFSNIWLQPIDDADARPLTNFTSDRIYNFAFSADGSRLYLARGYETCDVLLIKTSR